MEDLTDRELAPVYWSVGSGRPAALEGSSKRAVRLDLHMGDSSSIGEVLRPETSFVPSPVSCPGKPSLTSQLSAATDNSKIARPSLRLALELDAQVFFVVTGRMIDQQSI